MLHERVLRVGQWLGTANRVAAIHHHPRLGWLARDTTGESYCQNEPNGKPMLGTIYDDGPTGIVVWCPEGLRTSDDQYAYPDERVVSRWPDAAEVADDA